MPTRVRNSLLYDREQRHQVLGLYVYGNLLDVFRQRNHKCPSDRVNHRGNLSAHLGDSEHLWDRLEGEEMEKRR